VSAYPHLFSPLQIGNAPKGKVENLDRSGDCVAPRKLDHAIYEGYLAGRELERREPVAIDV
jgi:hypothetical protein